MPSTQRAWRGWVLPPVSLVLLLSLRGERHSSLSPVFSSAYHIGAPVSPGVSKRYRFNTNNEVIYRGTFKVQAGLGAESRLCVVTSWAEAPWQGGPVPALPSPPSPCLHPGCPFVPKKSIRGDYGCLFKCSSSHYPSDTYLQSFIKLGCTFHSSFLEY